MYLSCPNLMIQHTSFTAEQRGSHSAARVFERFFVVCVCVVGTLFTFARSPRQAYGALGMARSEFVADSASCQFFWLLFDSDLTPAGQFFNTASPSSLSHHRCRKTVSASCLRPDFVFFFSMHGEFSEPVRFAPEHVMCSVS